MTKKLLLAALFVLALGALAFVLLHDWDEPSPDPRSMGGPHLVTPRSSAAPTGLEDRYQVSPSTGGGYASGIYWYDETTNRTMNAGIAYIGGHAYSVHIKLEKTGDADFDADVKAKINGADATVEKYGDSIVVSATLACPAESIDAAALTVTAPAAGASPMYLASFSPSSLTFINRQMGSNEYCSNGVSWMDTDTHTYLKPSDVFQAGHAYEVSVGETFDAKGMKVLVAYVGSDESAEVTGYTLLPEKIDANTRAVAVVYTENGVTVSTTQPITLRSGRANPFTDVKESDYWYKAILWASEQGIANGTGEGALFPQHDLLPRRRGTLPLPPPLRLIDI